MENFATKKECEAFWASLNTMKASKENRRKVEQSFLIGPFKSGVVYAGLNCSREHQAAVQSAYDSLPQIVRSAFECTKYHIEGVGTGLDMATRLACEPPTFAMGVTNHVQDLVMIAEYAAGPTGQIGPDGKIVGKPIRGHDWVSINSATALSGLATTLAHEIGHVLDRCCPERGTTKHFLKALADDLAPLLVEFKDDQESAQLQNIAQTALQPQEAFAESFAYAVGFGGQARSMDYERRFSHCIAYVRGWFERNYDKFTERLAA